MDQEIKKELQKKLDPANVKQRNQGGQNLSYIEGWHAIAEANAIFGFDGWTRETIDLIENTQPTKNQKGNFVVSFRAKVRVTALGVVREGVGFGSGISRDIHDAYEGAIKEAETDAMKRALMTFGNRFGLALYDKTQSNVGKDVSLPTDEMKLLIDRVRDTKTLDELSDVRENAKSAWPRMSDEQKSTITDEMKRAQSRVAQAPLPEAAE